MLKTRIKEENAALLAEKTTWAMSAPSSEDAQRHWETEKSDLIKAREEVDATAKVGCIIVLRYPLT